MTQFYGLRLLREPRFQMVALVSMLGLVLVLRLAQFLVYSTQIQWAYDFSAYWQAAGNVLAHEPIYSAAQVAGPYSPQQQYLYLYPPFFAVAMTPFAVLFDDYRVGNWAWAAIGSAAVVLAVTLVARREGMVVGYRALLLVGCAFAFPPVIGELVLGNVHLVVLGLVAVTWWALLRSDPSTRRWEVIAGVLIGVATLIKLFPAIVVMWFLLRRRWTAAISSLVAMLTLAAATVPIVGLGPWLDYPTVLLNLGAPIDTIDTVAPTVWLSALVPHTVARLIVTAIGLGVVVWSTRRRSEPVSFAIAVVVSILIAPALYHHYLAVLILPLLLAVRWAPPIWWVALAFVLMWGGEQEVLGDFVWIVNRLLPTVGAVLLLAGLALRGVRPGFGAARSVGQ